MRFHVPNTEVNNPGTILLDKLLKFFPVHNVPSPYAFFVW
jgi:hypothetical protein